MIPAAVVCAGLLAWGISLVVSAGANASAGLSSAVGSMTSTVGRTLVIGVLSLAVTFGIHLAILRLAGRFDPRKRFSFALLFFLGACLCRTSFVTYLLFRQVGLINTVFPPALLSAFSPLPLMLTLGLVALRPRQTSACVKLALGAGFLSAACAMGEITNSSIYFSSSTGTIGMALKTVLVSSGALTEGGASLKSLTPLVLGLTLIITSLPLFAGTVLCIRGAKE